jgi:hypothetical protein
MPMNHRKITTKIISGISQAIMCVLLALAAKKCTTALGREL